MRLPRENQYVCEYGCLIGTVDVDVGVTPFMIQCRSRSTEKRPIGKKQELAFQIKKRDETE